MAVKQMLIQIETLAPLILTAAHDSQVMTSTQRLIPGNALRGVLANRYITQQNLGRDAHRDPQFRRLFLQKLRFLAAQPEKQEQRAFILPLSLLKAKKTSGEELENHPEIQDLLRNQQRKPGYKPLKGMAISTPQGLSLVQVPTRIKLHMTRSDKGRRLLGSSRDGGIFNYEAIKVGQRFLGCILGEQDDLMALLKGLQVTENSSILCHIGRSHFTEYGQCRLAFSNITDAENLIQREDITKDRVYLRLDAPFFPFGPADAARMKDAGALLQQVLQKHLGDEFSIKQIYSASAESGSFNGIWKMQQPQMVGLAAGTVFALQKNSPWTDVEIQKLNQLCFDGIGRGKQEGFGQLRHWPSQKTFLTDETERETVSKPTGFPQMVAQQVTGILLERIKEQLRIFAAEDVQSLYLGKGTAQFFSKLAMYLREAWYQAQKVTPSKGKQQVRVRHELEQLIQKKRTYQNGYQHDKKVKALSPFEKKLKGIALHGYSMEDYFDGDHLPYDVSPQRDWRRCLGDEKQRKQLLQDIGLQMDDLPVDDGECYFEYWRWFCRLGRKKAQQMNEGRS